MKIYELLTETLDTSEWGSWISPHGEIYSVGPASHAFFMRERYPQFMNAAGIFLLSQALADGWVRVIHDPDDEGVVGLDGLPTSIKRAWKIVGQDVLSEFRVLYINLVKPEDTEWRVRSAGSRSFDILRDKSKINQYINSLS